MITQQKAPQISSGNILPPHTIDIIIPEATQNLLTNPSAETDLVNWGVVGTGSIARSSAQQWAGIYSILATGLGAGSGPSCYIESGEIVTGRTYTASLYFLGQPGKYYQVRISSGPILLSPSILSYGIWQRAEYTFIANQDEFSGFGLIQMTTGGSNSVYIDAAQFECKPYATTYCDGDMVGFLRGRQDYAWDGARHASSSRRNGLTRSGGRPMSLKTFFLISSIVGLGIAPFETITTQLNNGGEYAQRNVARSRFFSLNGIVPGTNARDTRENTAKLTGALNPFRFQDEQPLVLHYQEVEEIDGVTPSMQACKMVAYPTANSLPGSTESSAGMTGTLEFKMMLPWIMRQVGGGSVLTAQDSLLTQTLMRRDPITGDWATVGSTTSQIHVIVARPGGGVYIGGDFTNLGGVSGANRIAYYDGATITPMSTGANQSVLDIAVAPNGDVIAVGSFTTIGGVAANRIAKWNGSVWSALGTGLSDVGYAAEFGTDGSILYVGGQFLNAGGVAVNRLARYSFATSTWSAFGTGANGIVNAIHRQTYGRVYIGGAFTTINGITLNGIGYYDGSTFQPMSTGASGLGAVYSIVSTPNGRITVAGSFTSLGGVAASSIGQWNGAQWESLGGGVGGVVNSMAASGNAIIVGGSSFVANDLPGSGAYAVWTGTNFIYGDMGPPARNVGAIYVAPDGALWLGLGASVNFANMAGSTLITNPGTAPAYPTFTIYGPTSGTDPKRLYHLVNMTNGAGIYLELDINPGEVITISLDPANIRVSSSWRGDIPGVVLPSTNSSGWTLNPGANYVNALVEDSTMIVTLSYQVGYNAIDDAVLRMTQ